mmetsp:Transcript_84141/g.238718  ORF Transcript_84141/g.238718 Transcript_84141/m.238718 type:complete len:268 (+) Transcript_84141:1615-2418(+)
MEPEGQRHRGFHGAVPNLLVREGLGAGGAELQEGGPELGHAVVPEELRLRVDRRGEGRQHVLQGLLLELVRERLQRRDDGRHHRGERGGVLGVEDLDELQHQVRGARAHLRRRVGEGGEEHRVHLVGVLDHALTDRRHEVLQNREGDDTARRVGASAAQLRDRGQKLRPLLREVDQLRGDGAGDRAGHLPRVALHRLARVAVDRGEELRHECLLCRPLQLLPAGFSVPEAFDELPEDDAGLLPQLRRDRAGRGEHGRQGSDELTRGA